MANNGINFTQGSRNNFESGGNLLSAVYLVRRGTNGVSTKPDVKIKNAPVYMLTPAGTMQF